MSEIRSPDHKVNNIMVLFFCKFLCFSITKNETFCKLHCRKKCICAYSISNLDIFWLSKFCKNYGFLIEQIDIRKLKIVFSLRLWLKHWYCKAHQFVINEYGKFMIQFAPLIAGCRHQRTYRILMICSSTHGCAAYLLLLCVFRVKTPSYVRNLCI